jgi:outer membrane protein assembly factor BamB
MTPAMPRNPTRALRTAALLAISVALATGCAATRNIFGGMTDKSDEPMPLSDISASVTPRQLWSMSVGKGDGRTGVGQRPTVLDGRVYAAAMEGGVSAIDLRSGQVAWRHASDLRLSGGPGAGDGLVVVGSLEGDVIALDAATGAVKWTAKVGNEVLAAPAVGGGSVFVRSNDGRVTAFDAANGQRRWFYSSEVPALSVRGNGGITVGPGFAFVGNDDGTLAALSATDGGVLWSTPVAQPDGRSELERMADVDGPAVLDGTTLYATSYKGATVAIDGPSGQVMWTRANGGPRGLAVSNSSVVVTDPQGRVWGLDKNTGGSLWQQEALLRRNVSAPAVQGDHAVVGDLDGVVHWLGLADGAFAARARMGSAIKGQPVVADDIVVVQSVDGQVAAFGLQ